MLAKTKSPKFYVFSANEKIQYLLADPKFVINAIHEKEEESLRLIYRMQSLQESLDEQKVRETFVCFCYVCTRFSL